MEKVRIEADKYRFRVGNTENRELRKWIKKKGCDIPLYNLIPIIGIGIQDSIKVGGITSLLFLFMLLSLTGSNKKNIKIGGIAFILTLFFTNILSFLGIFDKWLIASFLLFHFIYEIIGIIFFIWGILILCDYFKFKKDHRSTFFIPMPIISKSNVTKQNFPYIVILVISIITGILCSLLNSVLTLNKLVLLKFSFFIMIKDYTNAIFVPILYNLGFIVLHILLFFSIIYIYNNKLKKIDSLLIKYSIYVRLITAALFISSGVGFIYLFGA